LKGHSSPVLSVMFSPDGNRIASGSGDQTIRVWKANGAEMMGPPEGHGGSIGAVAISPDGHHLVSGSDMTIQAQAASGSKVRILSTLYIYTTLTNHVHHQDVQ
jgi:WD40 repeat protein